MKSCVLKNGDKEIMQETKCGINNDSFVFNFQQIRCLILFAMLYVSIMICNATLTNKWISFGKGFVFGGAFVSPMLFVLGDIIAEIFGYRISKVIIIVGFICQTIFAIIITVVLSTPAPSHWHEQHAF